MPKTIYNTRAPQMWEIIKPHVRFTGRTVTDYGFGWGDMLLYAYEAQAALPIKGVTVDRHQLLFFMQDRIQEERLPDRFFDLRLQRIEEIVRLKDEYGTSAIKSDIAFCFSVLPYVDRPVRFLHYLHANHDTVLLECQYAGDGSGFDWLQNDFKMSEWIGPIWKNRTRLGVTLVEDRNMYRTIWMCER